MICCGGAINSPQVLQLSGIGDPAVLKAAGVDVLHELPGVGQNLQDHLEVYIQYACKKPVSVWPALKWYNKPWVGLQWMLFKKALHQRITLKEEDLSGVMKRLLTLIFSFIFCRWRYGMMAVLHQAVMATRCMLAR